SRATAGVATAAAATAARRYLRMTEEPLSRAIACSRPTRGGNRGFISATALGRLAATCCMRATVELARLGGKLLKRNGKGPKNAPSGRLPTLEIPVPGLTPLRRPQSPRARL